MHSHPTALLALLALAVLPSLSHAQAPSRPPPLVSPEIEGGRVTFRLHAPEARAVVLRGQWTKDAVKMTRDAAGTWSAAIESVPAGVWEYSFTVDGLNVLDFHNPAFKPQHDLQKSVLHIAAQPPAPWDWQAVPHGTVHRHEYASQALGRPRELLVYTPPGYERAVGKSYPLLVLQHGSGDDQRTWVEHGKAHWILDSLIAAGKARPMILLMLEGHPLGPFPRDAGDKRAASLDAFRRELFEDALPLVEAAYRLAPGPEQRAIAGLSMGGWQALNIGLTHLDRFAWVGSFSGLPDEATIQPALDDAAGTNARLKLLWIAVGKDDFLRQRNEALISTLQQRGIRHQWRLTDGAHAWPVWRGYLAEFAPKLFQSP